MLYNLLASRVRPLIDQAALAKPVTIVVFPFQDLSPRSHGGAQTAQFTSELIRKLQRLPSVRVLQYSLRDGGGTPPENPAAVAKSLHAVATLEGTIGHDGTYTTISATLIRNSTGHALWSTQFEQQNEDLKAFQKRVVRTTALGIRNILF